MSECSRWESTSLPSRKRGDCWVSFLLTVVFFLLIRLCRRDPEVAEWVQVLKQRYAGMKIVVGRDKLDEIQVKTPRLVAHISS